MSEKLNFEEKILYTIQQKTKQLPQLKNIARGMSLFGEHAGGWVIMALLGFLVSKKRNQVTQQSKWLKLGIGTVLAHGFSIMIKRVVRRPRPDNPAIEVRVKTPSKLSFPSSHATSTAAAAVLLANVFRWKSWKTVLGLVSPMMLSRMLLGVHYPSDVVAGAAVGIATGEIVKKIG